MGFHRDSTRAAHHSLKSPSKVSVASRPRESSPESPRTVWTQFTTRRFPLKDMTTKNWKIIESDLRVTPSIRRSRRRPNWSAMSMSPWPDLISSQTLFWDVRSSFRSHAPWRGSEARFLWRAILASWTLIFSSASILTRWKFSSERLRTYLSMEVHSA